MNNQYEEYKKYVVSRIQMGQATKSDRETLESLLLNDFIIEQLGKEVFDAEMNYISEMFKEVGGKACKSKSKSEKPKKQAKQTKTTVSRPVIKDKLSEEKFTVHVPGHDIHYKEQLWSIQGRTLTYTFRLMQNMSRARELYYKLTGHDFCDGYRVFEIVTYDTIPSCLACIGYAVRNEKGYKAYLNHELLNEHKITGSKVTKAAEGCFKEACKGDKA